MLERIRADGGHACGNFDACQPVAVVERIRADGGQSAVFSKGHARKFAATVERRIADARHAAVSWNDTVFTTKHKCFACCSNQTVICTVIHGISACYGNAFEPAAISERKIADARYAAADSERREAAATIERLIADARHAIRNCNAREPSATGERRRADGSQLATFCEGHGC